MKKFLFILITLSLLLSGCNNEQQESSDTSSVGEKTVIDQALELIDEGKNYEAYKLLYDNRSDEEAKKLLDDFTVVYTSATGRGYYTYELIRVEEFNEHGDTTREYMETLYNNQEYVTDVSYEYTYTEDGKMLSKDTIYAEDNGLPRQQWDYFYDERGNLIKIEKQSAGVYDDKTGNYISYEEFRYNENDQLVYKASVNVENNLDFYYEYTYDEKGRISTENYFNTEPNKYLREYTYNEDDIIIKEVENLDNHITTTEYTLNEHGDIIKDTKTTDYNDIKTVIEYEYEYTYDETGKITKKYMVWPNQESDTTEYIYNEQGDVIKETVSSSVNYTKVNEYEYEYNDDGEKTKITTKTNEYRESKASYEYDSHGSKIYEASASTERRYEYTYDELGRVVTMVQNFDTKRMFEYTYDENNNEIKRVVYAVDTPDIKNTTEQVFDENGKVIKITESSENGSYVYVTTHTYDERGNILTRFKVRENSEAETDQVYTYKYDENGNILEQTVEARRTGGKNKYVFEYDVNGNRIKEELYHEDAKLYITTEHTYDSENRVVKTVIEYAEEKKLPTIYEYEYDECGNLIYEFRMNEQYSGNNVATSYTYSNYEYYYTPNKPTDK